jgi:hypothetical protein
MHEADFDRWTRQTAVASPRRSLLTVSAAALLGAVLPPAVVTASPRGKACKKACQAQGSQCETTLRAFCQKVDPGGNGCLQTVLPCCAPLTTCDAAAAIQCVLALVPPGPLGAD